MITDYRYQITFLIGGGRAVPWIKAKKWGWGRGWGWGCGEEGGGSAVNLLYRVYYPSLLIIDIQCKNTWVAM